MRVLGIDPGLTGGAAVYDSGTDLLGQRLIVDAIDLPTIGTGAARGIDVLALQRWIVALRPDRAFIERAQAMPKQGASSGFIYGTANGELRATVMLSNVPLERVEPTKWKKHFGLKGGDKESARQKIIMLVPSSSRLFERKKDHGRAEAALIAIYGASLVAPRE